MSNEALTWAYRQTTGNAGRKAVLVALADKADESHSCWPSQATLAAMTEQSDRTVRGHLAALEASGFIARAARRDKAGHRSSDRYVLAVSVAVGVTNRQNPPVATPAGRTARRAANTAETQPAESATRANGLPAENVAPTGKIRQVTQREPTKAPTVPSRREDVERLCAHLADRIAGNDADSKRPVITQRWRDAARLLMDRDGRPEEKIHLAIDWCQDDEFWRANIMSMTKLREKYRQLQAQAQRPTGRRGTPTPVQTADWMRGRAG